MDALARGARAAKRGDRVLLIDLYGTGDSGGDFGDATLPIWREDLRRGAAWLTERGVVRLDVSTRRCDRPVPDEHGRLSREEPPLDRVDMSDMIRECRTSCW